MSATDAAPQAVCMPAAPAPPDSGAASVQRMAVVGSCPHNDYAVLVRAASGLVPLSPEGAPWRRSQGNILLLSFNTDCVLLFRAHISMRYGWSNGWTPTLPCIPLYSATRVSTRSTLSDTPQSRLRMRYQRLCETRLRWETHMQHCIPPKV